MINWSEILDELNVPYWTAGKNVIPGATCIQCPCCDDHSHHGNLLPDGGYKCWRCSGAHPVSIISRLAHVDYFTAQKLINSRTSGTVNNSIKEQVKYSESIRIPGSPRPLKIHEDYLKNRGLNPSDLEFNYGIRYTGMGARDNGMDISFRVIIPIMDLHSNIIAWQGRDVTNRHPLRYVFPKVDKCLDHYKHTLYGAHMVKKSDTILVCEGVFDQWKLSLAGAPAVATFGTSTTREQIALMAAWKRIIIAFDNETEAQNHAHEIAVSLSAMGRDVYLAPASFGTNSDNSVRDFGDLSEAEIKEYIKDIL